VGSCGPANTLARRITFTRVLFPRPRYLQVESSAETESRTSASGSSVSLFCFLSFVTSDADQEKTFEYLLVFYYSH
jgi:hypothetical protein